MQKQIKFTIGIAARNEEKNIKATLLSIYDALLFLQKKMNTKYELIIYVNNTTDNTVKIAKETLQNIILKNFTYQVFDTEKAGKANAINSIVSHSNYDLLIFCDGDIIIKKETIFLLIQGFLKDSTKKAFTTAGFPKKIFYLNPVKAKRSIKMIEYASKESNIIDGTMYMIQKKFMPKLPENIINEDTFIGTTCGTKNIKKLPDAIIYQDAVDSFYEYYKRKKRISLGQKQMYDYFPGGEYETYRHDSRDTRSKKQRKQSLGFLLKLYNTVLFPIDIILKLIDRNIKKEIKTIDQYQVGW